MWVCACLWILTLSRVARGQDLEPRAYSPSPTGANFLLIGFGNTSGPVLSDPTLPITDVHATLYSPTLGLGRTFGLFGRQALVTAALPYVWGSIQGQVFEQQHDITRSGLADFRLKLSFNLHGSPALSPQEFTRYRKRSLIVGTSVLVMAPTGQYDRTKLINISTNRWTFKPELGISYPYKKWTYDFYTAVWLFTENSSFYPGQSKRQQNPIPSLQAHVSYTIRQHLWLALDGTWYSGGTTSVNNGPPTGRQNNIRFGTTLSLPIGRGQSIKVAYSRGATARAGANFSAVGVSWQFLWFDHHGR